MGVLRTIGIRALTLIGVVIAVLLMLVIVLGVTGLSDKMLKAIADQILMEIRQGLAREIKDPEALKAAIEQQRMEIYAAFGLDKPWYARIPDMVVRVMTFDLGYTRTIKSFTGSQWVADIIWERLPNTILLVTTAIAISAVLGLIIGVKVATRPGSRLDRVASYFSAISFALPTWWTGIIFIFVFAFYFRLFPFGGMYSAPPPEEPLARFLDLLWHAALPVTTLVVALVGSWIYVTRTIVLNTAQEDFVAAARAKGLPESVVRRRYIIRVAAPPILTNIVLGLAGSIGGAIITETVFQWPGMGSLYYQAIFSLEENLIIALTFIFTVVYVAARFILEILYIVLDPRVRY